jgi:hypothetical protein
MAIRKQAWSVVGDLQLQPDGRIDWEIDLQYRLWGKGYAVGVTDCNSFTTDCPGCAKLNEDRNYTTLWKSSARYAASREPEQVPVQWFRQKRIAEETKLNDQIQTANKRLSKKYLFDKYPLDSVTYPKPKAPRCALPSFKTDKRVDKCTAILMSYPGGRLEKLGQILQTLLSSTGDYSGVIAEVILVWNGPEDGVPKDIQALSSSRVSTLPSGCISAEFASESLPPFP